MRSKWKTPGHESKSNYNSVESLDEIFKNITSQYVDTLPMIKPEIKELDKKERYENSRERLRRLKDYKRTLLRRKKELIGNSLSNIVKDALGLMNYANHFTEQELKDLEDIENGRDLVNFK